MKLTKDQFNAVTVGVIAVVAILAIMLMITSTDRLSGEYIGLANTIYGQAPKDGCTPWPECKSGGGSGSDNVDLTIVGENWPTSVSNGDRVAFDVAVTNLGSSKTSRWFHDRFDIQGANIQQLRQSQLRAGETRRYTVYWDADVCGAVSVSAITDATDKSSESNENNNVFTRTLNVDCGNPNPDYCGDNVCNNGETCSTCSNDCGVCQPVCGNDFCETGESCSTCSSDCGVCQPVCGDNVCDTESGESCSTCSSDCGSCPASTFCGDGIVQSPNDNGQYEQCDDGNTQNGDGCSSTCQQEVPTTPSFPPPPPA